MDKLQEAQRYIRDKLPMEPDLPEVFTAAELLSAKFPPKFFEHKNGSVHVYWGGYDYNFALNRIKTPLDVLDWVHHLSHKNWPLMTPNQLGDFAKALAGWKGWSIHGGSNPDG